MATDTLILDLWQLYEHLKVGLDKVTEFMNMTLAEALTYRPFLPDTLANKIEEYILEQTSLGQTTVMSLMIGSGIMIFLVITFFKWLLDFI